MIFQPLRSLSWMLGSALCVCLAPAGIACGGAAEERTPAQDELEPVTPVPVPIEKILLDLRSFQPMPGARFGTAVVTLDFDGDGHDDVAVGAPGESAVYVFLGPGFERVRRYRPTQMQPNDGFGMALAAGPIDDRPGDELLVGAPGRTVGGVAGAGAVFVISRRNANPILVNVAGMPRGALGTSLAVGDFDGDGELDVAAGAPKHEIDGVESGAVALVRPQGWLLTVLENPRGAQLHGNYGHDLAVGDATGDGVDDLLVSGIGNPSESGVAGAGQVFVHLRPLTAEASTIVVEDPAPTPGDPGRFGMSISVGDVDGDGLADLLVGAPRKDGGGVSDAGSGFLYLAPLFESESALVLLRPDALPHDILGFRALIAPVFGVEGNAAVLASLASQQPMALLVWAPAGLAGPPQIHHAPAGASHHFVQGLRRGPSLARQPETLLLGDPNYDPGDRPDSGRILVVELGARKTPVPVPPAAGRGPAR